MKKRPRMFQTERTSRLRATKLNEMEERTVSAIEEFGCQIIHVRQYKASLDFYYTVGLYDTCGKPEIVTVGMSPETAHFLLNEAADRSRGGLDLTKQRQEGMVGEVECEFRPIARLWTEHLMGSAIWYYGKLRFPVLQAVFSDHKNRFP